MKWEKEEFSRQLLMRNISKGPSILSTTPRTAQGSRRIKTHSLNEIGINKRIENP
jgi:hypothetical protein